MNDKDKQEALLELGSKTLDAIVKAHKDLEGLALGAVLCGIRVSYEIQARAIINYTSPIESDNSIIVGPNVGEFRGVEAITIKEGSEE